jgi:hypothetical protein
MDSRQAHRADLRVLGVRWANLRTNPGAVEWPGVPVRADGEDRVGCEGGADRALVAAGSRDIEHTGSAHDDAELEVQKTAARQRPTASQGELDLGLGCGRPAGSPLPITLSRTGHLHDALSRAYDVLGFERAAGADEVFGQLVLARIIESVSKLDSPTAPGRPGAGGVAQAHDHVV